MLSSAGRDADRHVRISIPWRSPPGIANALTERGGICADVVEEGDIETGDRVKIVEADPRTAGNAIAERLAAKQEE